ncbi:hypothetical protein BS78_K338700 [Paspalum vaginatum]|uniref:Uncharacterized protein n=1 Tax=Paspalum vaginatum TaxID=158149 RepID=A0A9W7XCL0_9POAL|nr:hypothetical protein BS78_K338700 [Paspalum vaginatum]
MPVQGRRRRGILSFLLTPRPPHLSWVQAVRSYVVTAAPPAVGSDAARGRSGVPWGGSGGGCRPSWARQRGRPVVSGAGLGGAAGLSAPLFLVAVALAVEALVRPGAVASQVVAARDVLPASLSALVARRPSAPVWRLGGGVPCSSWISAPCGPHLHFRACPSSVLLLGGGAGRKLGLADDARANGGGAGGVAFFLKRSH